MGLKLIFLIVTRAVSLLGLSRQERWWKDAEILMLRHQLAVAERERPRAHSRLTWPDRAWLALLAGTVPVERLAAMRADRHSRQYPAMAARHRAPPVGVPVTPGPFRAPCHAPQSTVSGAAACPGERVLRLSPHPRRTRRARHHLAPSTVWQILRNAGIDPAPGSGAPGWAGFLRS